jgi:hypothetical protein
MRRARRDDATERASAGDDDDVFHAQTRRSPSPSPSRHRKRRTRRKHDTPHGYATSPVAATVDQGRSEQRNVAHTDDRCARDNDTVAVPDSDTNRASNSACNGVVAYGAAGGASNGAGDAAGGAHTARVSAAAAAAAASASALERLETMASVEWAVVDAGDPPDRPQWAIDAGRDREDVCARLRTALETPPRDVRNCHPGLLGRVCVAVSARWPTEAENGTLRWGTILDAAADGAPCDDAIRAFAGEVREFAETASRCHTLWIGAVSLHTKIMRALSRLPWDESAPLLGFLQLLRDPSFIECPRGHVYLLSNGGVMVGTRDRPHMGLVSKGGTESWFGAPRRDPEWDTSSSLPAWTEPWAATHYLQRSKAVAAMRAVHCTHAHRNEVLRLFEQASRRLLVARTAARDGPVPTSCTDLLPGPAGAPPAARSPVRLRVEARVQALAAREAAPFEFSANPMSTEEVDAMVRKAVSIVASAVPAFVLDSELSSVRIETADAIAGALHTVRAACLCGIETDGVPVGIAARMREAESLAREVHPRSATHTAKEVDDALSLLETIPYVAIEPHATEIALANNARQTHAVTMRHVRAVFASCAKTLAERAERHTLTADDVALLEHPVAHACMAAVGAPLRVVACDLITRHAARILQRVPV